MIAEEALAAAEWVLPHIPLGLLARPSHLDLRQLTPVVVVGKVFVVLLLELVHQFLFRIFELSPLIDGKVDEFDLLGVPVLIVELPRPCAQVEHLDRLFAEPSRFYILQYLFVLLAP